MQNRWVLLLICYVFSVSLYAQELRLQKNGTLKTVKFKLPKKISITFKKDSESESRRGKVISYKFPLLLIKEEKDTIAVDVRSIQLIKLTSKNLPVYLGGMIITGLITIAYVTVFPPVALIPGSLTCIIYRSAFKKLNTDTEWSFY